MRLMVRILRRVNLGFAVLAGLMILAMEFIVNLEVIMRYFVDRPITWGVEIGSYLLFAVVLLGAGYTLQEGGHVNVDAIRQLLPTRGRLILDTISPAIGMIFGLVLLIEGVRLTLQAWQGHWLSETLLAVPLWRVYIIMPVGSLVLVLSYLVVWQDAIRALLDEFRAG